MYSIQCVCCGSKIVSSKPNGLCVKCIAKRAFKGKVIACKEAIKAENDAYAVWFKNRKRSPARRTTEQAMRDCGLGKVKGQS